MSLHVVLLIFSSQFLLSTANLDLGIDISHITQENRAEIKNAVKKYIREKGLITKIQLRLSSQKSLADDLSEEFGDHFEKMNRELEKPSLRHVAATTALFSAYGNFESRCVQGTVMGFTETLDVSFNGAVGGFNNGIFTVVNPGFYWFYFSSLCDNNSICDLTFRMNGVVVGNMGNRANCYCNNHRFNSVDNGMVQNMPAVGNTMSVMMENPDTPPRERNCIRSGLFRYVQFAGFIITTAA